MAACNHPGDITVNIMGTDKGHRIGDTLGTMAAMKYPNRLALVMDHARMSGSTLAKLTHTTRQQVHKFRKGERELTARWAERFAQALDVDWPALISETHAGGEPILSNNRGNRLKAARWACWEEPEVAAKTMRIDLRDLLAVEAGADAEIPAVLLNRFCLVTGTPLRWIEAGEMAGMDPEMSARIGMFAPELVPERPAPKRSGGSRGDSSDGNES